MVSRDPATAAAGLPRELPAFPLTAALLLPGNYLPLNVFEPRYRNLVEDVAAAELHVAMVQPRTPALDGFGLGPDNPGLYTVGCAGLLESLERQADGRYLVVLRGIARFEIDRELEPRRGYRRLQVDYRRFAADFEEDASAVDATPLLAAVDRYARRQGLEFDLDLLASLDGLRLLNALCAALPFAAAEQQVLLEAATAGERQRLLLELMELGGEAPAGEPYVQPTVH